MCGIVGYVGGRQAYPILIKGLTRLEYRGYDSAGVALIGNGGDLVIYKTKGKVRDLEKLASAQDVSGTIGIAHTRWATHGEPSDVNSHPHYSENHRLALIHNGIIENYQAVKTELDAQRAKAKELEASVDPALLEEYNTIKRRISPPVARLTYGQCSGCNTSLPSATLAKIKGGALVECETCGRMIIQ